MKFEYNLFEAGENPFLIIYYLYQTNKSISLHNFQAVIR